MVYNTHAKFMGFCGFSIREPRPPDPSFSMSVFLNIYTFFILSLPLVSAPRPLSPCKAVASHQPEKELEDQRIPSSSAWQIRSLLGSSQKHGWLPSSGIADRSQIQPDLTLLHTPAFLRLCLTGQDRMVTRISRWWAESPFSLSTRECQ